MYLFLLTPEFHCQAESLAHIAFHIQLIFTGYQQNWEEKGDGQKEVKWSLPQTQCLDHL